MATTTAWQDAFRKRHVTLFKKAHECKDLSPANVKVHVVLERTDKRTLYFWNSEDESSATSWVIGQPGEYQKYSSMGPRDLHEINETRPKRPRRKGKANEIDPKLLDLEQSLSQWGSEEDEHVEADSQHELGIKHYPIQASLLTPSPGAPQGAQEPRATRRQSLDGTLIQRTPSSFDAARSGCARKRQLESLSYTSTSPKSTEPFLTPSKRLRTSSYKAVGPPVLERSPTERFF